MRPAFGFRDDPIGEPTVDSDEELRMALDATRSVVKASMRSLRTCLQFLADIEEKLDLAQPKEAQRNGSTSSTRAEAAAAELTAAAGR